MSNEKKKHLYVKPEQHRIIKARSAKLGYGSMGDYVWSLVVRDMDLHERAELSVSEKVK